jgi:hypothetical protein
MVRRLKRDLRQLGVERFPRRILTRIVVEHSQVEGAGWSASSERYDPEQDLREPLTAIANQLGGENFELVLAEQLARYTELCAPATPRGRLTFINLQKRLLSSPEAFFRTLEVHAAALHQAGISLPPPQTELLEDPETYGDSDETLAAEEDAQVHASSAELPTPTQEATALLASYSAETSPSRIAWRTRPATLWHSSLAMMRPR